MLAELSPRFFSAPLVCAALLVGAPLRAQSAPAEGEPTIGVNGFFVEEAYNQEAGVLQQFAHYTAGRDGHWLLRLEQEWPIFSERHQLDLELGIDDVRLQSFGLGYRFMLLGGEDEPLTITPGVEATLSRDAKPEYEAALPVSFAFAEGWTSNSSVGVSFTPGEDEVGFTAGEGVMRRVGSSLNLLVEALYSTDESPIPGDETEGSVFVIPGFQYAFDLSPRVQLVPGVAMPIGVGKANGERGVLLYLSIEHPLPRLVGTRAPRMPR